MKRSLSLLGKEFLLDNTFNIPNSLLQKIPIRLDQRPGHPIHTMRLLAEQAMNRLEPNVYQSITDDHPVVSVKENFDDLLIPKGHPGRLPSDSYYLNEGQLLRTHTSAHQMRALQSKRSDGYLLTADVYRRDQIDVSHYPVFHQMEGLRVFPPNFNQSLFPKNDSIQDTSTMGSLNNPLQKIHHPEQAQAIAAHLKYTLEHFVRALFHPNIPIRWIDAYFPFTAPSFEMEIYHNGQWLEVLGCGVIQQAIMTNSGLENNLGWAFGLGLDRLAMVLYQIPDIRLFWSQDARFLSQFKEGKVSTFKPFSKYPHCYKDVSFWCKEGQLFLENDMFDLVRDVAGDVAEQVTLLDRYQKQNRESQCYRIEYRSMERTLTNAEVDSIQDRVRERLVEEYGVTLR